MNGEAGCVDLMILAMAQESITLVVFLVYAFIVFREVPRWNTLLAMGLIVGAVYLTFVDRGQGF